MRKFLIIFLLFTAICLLASCAAPAPAASDYNLVATIKDIMDSAVDPSADYIWESLGTEVDAAGVHDKRPQNDEEWKEERAPGHIAAMREYMQQEQAKAKSAAAAS